NVLNTLKDLMIYKEFGFKTSKNDNMILIVNEKLKKLSKSYGKILQFIEQYKDLGYLPEALFNFIGLLGWSPEGEEEIFSKEEFIKIFDEKRLSKSQAFYDKKKLEWINNQNMKEKDSENEFEITNHHMV